VDAPPSTIPPLPARAWKALSERGPRYAWHKALRRSLGRWPGLKRRLVYADPRDYWTLRGGRDYFLEQEGQPLRTERARWMAERIAAYRPRSILEVGCGYGKQVRALRERLDVPIVGIDFSPTQLGMARQYVRGLENVSLVLGSGARLPFEDGAFDLVLTSAVILHNPPTTAEAIRSEVLRVAGRWAAHNEDLDLSYNRYGYDTAAWYAERGLPLAECGPIPVEPDGPPSQFCVAGPWPR
jgi:SAM-dependent methyltransferase